MFDLPTQTKKDVQNYAKFRRNIINLGFYMIQFSIYARLCINHDEAIKVDAVLTTILPPNGNIRTLIITEKQYQSMNILVGEISCQEQYANTDYLVEL